MLNLITISISFFLIILTGWTVTTYFIKKDSQEVIREELTNLFDIGKKFFLSLKNLIGILTSTSLSPKKRETTPVEEIVSKQDEHLFKVVHPINEIKEESVESVESTTPQDIVPPKEDDTMTYFEKLANS